MATITALFNAIDPCHYW